MFINCSKFKLEFANRKRKHPDWIVDAFFVG